MSITFPSSGRTCHARQYPVGSAKGALLEELLFALLSAMGASDIVWRTGGTGGGAADGGRDLEVKFPRTTPEGDFELEKWWIESKGRAGTVEPDAVKSAILNASGRQDVDVLVIATNTQYSNPTRDWVEGWARSQPRPKIRLWDRASLPNLIEKHPVAASRIVPSILKDDERLEALTKHFWQVGRPPFLEDAKYFWEKRAAVQSLEAITSMVAAEVIYGDLGDRPWGLLVTEENATQAAIFALGVFPLEFMRLQTLPDEKMAQVSAYLLQSALRVGEPEAIFDVIKQPLLYVDGGKIEAFRAAADGYQQYITLPLREVAVGQLRDACIKDCGRLMGDTGHLGPDPASEIFWRRFNKDLPGHSDRIFTMINRREPCVIGLPLSEDRECPFFDPESISLNMVEDIKYVIRTRMVRPTDQWNPRSNRSFEE
ncbi:restriction endonuclease [Nonomuraea sp. NPDC049655]|uniref:restriction endonuclease n=1 Tax=Nonomuraea sp. NPDC049655 TaxID=3364355 RepID=UPI0037BD1A2A